MTQQNMPDWVYNQMIEGLQKLLVLRLAGAPPADAVEAVAAVWEEALAPRVWAWLPERDQGRLPAAFRHLILAAERWPSPKMLAEHIPPRPQEMTALLGWQRPPPTAAERAAAARVCAEMRTLLGRMSMKPRQGKKHD